MQQLKNLSIVVPAKLESKNLEFILPILKKYSEDIIVVDGHSKDDTRLVCERNKVKLGWKPKRNINDILKSFFNNKLKK